MEQSAWSEISALVAAAPYPVEVLPVDPPQAAACLAALEISTGSWLGAVVANSGGLVIDHGWLRVLGVGTRGCRMWLPRWIPRLVVWSLPST